MKTAFLLIMRCFLATSQIFKTLPLIVEKMKKKHNISNAILIADKGINSADNLLCLKDSGIGFIVSQKLNEICPKDEKALSDLLDEKNFEPAPVQTDKDDVVTYRIVDYQKQVTI